ncbi:hypothetical protein QWY85_04550 [Neolewinella lacunae]|uniref:Uncharacterized protein n=1 Tax=Neolewinella lacunae TaxID=1517758 RepID=A0A923PI49_9BACT|nr:hypothetical protein [Neolewinella lacunae]MBC6994568.1 hypothetical protein [Neolewinella lacunae]MDN3633917.1 hypothetical protein [Neolewinella lacunae]
METTEIFFWIREFFSKNVTAFRLNKLHFYLTDEEKVSFLLIDRNISEVKSLPIDRFYLEAYIDEIGRLNPVDFIVFNFKWFAESYVHRLMVCLPELFSKLKYEDIVEVFSKSRDPETIKSLVKFIDKYCPGINPLDLLNRASLSKFTITSVEQYFRSENILQGPITKSTVITKKNIGMDIEDFQRSLRRIQMSARN